MENDFNSLRARVIEAAGGIVALARELGITHQAVYSWRAIPPAHALKIEAMTGISRHELAPQIFGPPPDSPKRVGRSAARQTSRMRTSKRRNFEKG
jgi:DNA-binding transcriptional regulator YdaS (Cro superfamily)